MILLAAALALAPADEKWEPLFDGKSLTHWSPKIKGYPAGENYADTFRVEDGKIVVRYDKYTEFGEKYGHLYYTKEKFSHYRVRIEYRFVGDQVKGGPGWALRNSGVMLHCQPIETMAKDQSFPVSVEVQFLGGNGSAKRSTCNVCTPGTNIVYQGKFHTPHCTNSTSDTFHGDQWVTSETEVLGSGKVTHFVNGKPVLEYEQVQYDPKDPDAKPLIKGKELLISEGYLSLQSESHPVEFRKVEVKRLK